ncbi:hypothetical protein CLV56_1861 [Mumia flava]|uniref:Uncharacterized protein n=1 Tax=Mumia flava TaxID=1348852 RepID=A0A0B2B6F0_9ACTN|nr:hypothetical protein [Mumia flava]PJJ57625.1 hypothetical protein CLV56_1861 [Mumia flava]
MSARPVSGYRVALPPPWTRIPLRRGTEDAVRAIVDDVAEHHTPKEIPPDQVGPKKRELVAAMMTQARESADKGGVDLYIPLDAIHGYAVEASFVVSEVTPSALMEADEVPQVMASLLRDPGTEPVTVADTVWVRRLVEVPPPDADSAPSKRVEYVTALPGAPRYWILSSFATVGDPITGADGEGDLRIELFDAIMSTWRWEYDEEGSGG